MLNVKRKKRLRRLGFFAVFGGGWIFHGWLAALSGMDIRNEGVSFGWSGWAVMGLSLGLLGFLSWFGGKNGGLGLGVILIGGWINMIDRLVWGYVRDYWWLGPVYNNIADWMIFVGVGIFIWEIWKKK